VLGYLLDVTAFIGLSLSEAGSGTALLKCDILFVNLIAMFIYKQKFSKVDWACTFVMLFGVLMVMKVDFANFSLGNAGNIFFILSALFVSINAFVIKSVQKHKTCPAENNVIAFYNNMVTMVLFTLTAIFTGTIGQLKTIPSNKALITALIFAGLGQTLVYIFYYRNLKRFPVWLVKVFLLFMPIVVSIISFVLFDDRMVLNQYMGMAIVLIGALGILFEQKKKDALTANN
jgi:drug/metabolite transporter (DMT)-like permease